MKIRFLIIILFASLLVSTVSAATASTVNVTTLLNSALADMQCRVTFETDFINTIITLFPSLSSSLSPKAAAIQSDFSQLSQYASQADVESYRIYVQETFTQHLKQDQNAIRAGLDNIRLNMANMTKDMKNVTKTSFRTLKSSQKSLMEALDNCSALNKHTNLVLQYYNDTLNRYEARAQNMTDKGINASNLFDLVNSARTQILAPLQNEVSQAKNASSLNIAFSHYCLYDGCAKGINFHMAAKFETLRLTDLFAVIAPKATAAGLGSNVTAVQISLNATITEINSLGTGDVSADNLKAIWIDIRSIARELNDLFTALKGGINE